MPTLGYWKIKGLAQPIRMLLEYAGEKFDDVQYEQGDAPSYSRDAWLKVKFDQGLDFPNLPYYIDGKIKITQSNAILRYIARKHNLLGETEEEKVNVDIMLENAMDFRNAVVRMCYNPDYEKMLKAYAGDSMKAFLQGYDDWLKNKEFFGGSKVTVVDFPMYELLDQHTKMVPGCLDNYKNLTAFMERFRNLPKVKAFLAEEKYSKLPINNKVAMFK